MHLTIHAETADSEQPLVYEGTSVDEAANFIDSLQDVSSLQCNLYSENEHGEQHSLARRVVADRSREGYIDYVEPVGAFIEDIKSWLAENA